jgi:hypothetical protein
MAINFRETTTVLVSKEVELWNTMY